MAQDRIFRWHDRTRLFANGVQVSGADAAPGFLAIPADDTAAALALLGGALANSHSFCVHDAQLSRGTYTTPPYFMTLTGGSSGRPKLIRRTQASWIASFEVNARLFGLGPDDSVAVLGRLSHSLALYAVIEAAYLGADAHVLDALRPSAQITALQTISVLYATPTQLRLLSRKSDAKATGTRLILVGGGMLDAATHSAAQAAFPNAAIHEFYGAAETSFVTLTDATTPQGSVGRAYPGVEIDLRQGEIWVRSPYLFDGYAPDFATTADGFTSVGEMGRLDDAGNLWLHGRASRMVTVADQNVFPEAAEALIAGTGAPPCAVLALPDKLRGHHLVVVLEGPTDAKRAQHVLEMCRAELGPLAAPRRVLFHPDFPLLASGKPDLQQLASWAENAP